MRKVPFRYSTLAIAIAGLLGSYMAYGSVVRSDIPYQDFRDFAENKGNLRSGRQIFLFITPVAIELAVPW